MGTGVPETQVTVPTLNSEKRACEYLRMVSPSEDRDRHKTKEVYVKEDTGSQRKTFPS